MKDDQILDRNLERLLTAAVGKRDEQLDTDLTRVVQSAVSAGRRRRAVQRISAAGAVAAALALAVVSAWQLWHPTPRAAGHVRRLYGSVSILDEGRFQAVPNSAGLHTGQWIETRTGSRAEVLLMDRSKVLVSPRTRVQIGTTRHGARAVLERGSVSVQAAKQAPGESLSVETPGALISVRGTRLDVYVVQKPDGRRQTQVDVTSGHVDLQSAGETITLSANMTGIADEGLPPTARSMTEEVNELVRLIERGKRLADEAGMRAGMPSIVAFSGDGTATVWTVATVTNNTGEPLDRYVPWTNGCPAGAKAFTLAGAILAVDAVDGALVAGGSGPLLGPGQTMSVILRVPGLKGLFQPRGAGVFELSVPATSQEALTLVQVRLPRSATLEETYPEAVENRETELKLIVTFAANSALADVAGLNR